MRKCSEECIPCCDYCKYVVHEIYDDSIGPPIECMLHNDEKYRRLIEDCSYCEDFYCGRVEFFEP